MTIEEARKLMANYTDKGLERFIAYAQAEIEFRTTNPAVIKLDDNEKRLKEARERLAAFKMVEAERAVK